jgi:hypothetical protein
MLFEAGNSAATIPDNEMLSEAGNSAATIPDNEMLSEAGNSDATIPDNEMLSEAIICNENKKRAASENDIVSVVYKKQNCSNQPSSKYPADTQKRMKRYELIKLTIPRSIEELIS